MRGGRTKNSTNEIGSAITTSVDITDILSDQLAC